MDYSSKTIYGIVLIVTKCPAANYCEDDLIEQAFNYKLTGSTLNNKRSIRRKADKEWRSAHEKEDERDERGT